MIIKKPLAEISSIVLSGKAHEHFNLHDSFMVGEHEFEIIGFNHDRVHKDDSRHTITVMSKTLLDEKRFHKGSCEQGWAGSNIRKWLNLKVYKQLPAELTRYICRAVKTTHNSNGEQFTTADKLFIPSEYEIFGERIRAGGIDGKQYPAFEQRHNRIRHDKHRNSDWYWTRSAYGGNSTSVCFVSYLGNAGYTSASDTRVRAPLCFLFS